MCDVMLHVTLRLPARDKITVPCNPHSPMVIFALCEYFPSVSISYYGLFLVGDSVFVCTSNVKEVNWILIPAIPKCFLPSSSPASHLLLCFTDAHIEHKLSCTLYLIPQKGPCILCSTLLLKSIFN